MPVKLPSILHGKSKISVFSNDLEVQKQKNISVADVFAMNRLYGLLFDYIYLPFSFIFRSSSTRNALYVDAEYYKNFCIIGYDDQFSNFNEYLEKRIQSFSLDERQIEQIIDLIKFKPSKITYNAYEMGSIALNYFFNKLKSYNSRIFIKLKKAYPHTILNRNWVRQWGFDNISSQIIRNTLQKISNEAYIFGHAKYYKWRVEIPPIEQFTVLESYSQPLLNLFNINLRPLSMLEIDDLLNIRKDPTIVRLRQSLSDRFGINQPIEEQEFVDILMNSITTQISTKGPDITIYNLPQFMKYLENYGTRMDNSIQFLMSIISRFGSFTGSKIEIKRKSGMKRNYFQCYLHRKPIGLIEELLSILIND